MSIGDGGYGERDHTGGEPEPGRAPGRLTTRTRLPDGERLARQPVRPGRGVITVVGIVVLLIAAIAFANRGGGDGGEARPEADDKGAGAQPTAPTGKKPVDTAEGAIPSGFAHSEQGAQSAAANYAVALGGDRMFNTESRHEVVDAIYTSSAADKFKAAQDQAYSSAFLKRLGLDEEGKPPEGKSFVSKTIPVGTKVTKFDKDSATAQVWYTGLIGLAGSGSKNPVTTTWKTWTFKLQWNQGDWKVTSDAQKDGPAPVQGDDPAAGAEEISDAVEGYGGFTYAR